MCRGPDGGRALRSGTGVPGPGLAAGVNVFLPAEVARRGNCVSAASPAWASCQGHAAGNAHALPMLASPNRSPNWIDAA